jgi:hypothetical protein
MMAKKAAAKKAGQKEAAKPAPPTRAKRENVIEHLAQEIESRFFEGAEMATETTSAETNVVLAALGAIEGPHDVEPKRTRKAAHGKRKTPRPKAH